MLKRIDNGVCTMFSISEEEVLWRQHQERTRVKKTAKKTTPFGWRGHVRNPR